MPQVPNVIGRRYDEASRALRVFADVRWRSKIAIGAAPNVTRAPPGVRVVDQDPKADHGADVPPDRTILLIVDTSVFLPDFTGQTVGFARKWSSDTGVLVVCESLSGLPADPTDATMIAHNLGTSKSKAGAHANVGDTIGVIIVMP